MKRYLGWIDDLLVLEDAGTGEDEIIFDECSNGKV